MSSVNGDDLVPLVPQRIRLELIVEHARLAEAQLQFFWRVVDVYLSYGITGDVLAETLGISRATLYRRVNAHRAGQVVFP